MNFTFICQLLLSVYEYCPSPHFGFSHTNEIMFTCIPTKCLRLQWTFEFVRHFWHLLYNRCCLCSHRLLLIKTKVTEIVLCLKHKICKHFSGFVATFLRDGLYRFHPYLYLFLVPNWSLHPDRSTNLADYCIMIEHIGLVQVITSGPFSS